MLTYKQQLELQNKLMAAQFGIDQIIDLCELNIKTYEKLGLNGSSIKVILKMAKAIKKEVDAKP